MADSWDHRTSPSHLGPLQSQPATPQNVDLMTLPCWSLYLQGLAQSLCFLSVSDELVFSLLFTFPGLGKFKLQTMNSLFYNRCIRSFKYAPETQIEVVALHFVYKTWPYCVCYEQSFVESV